MRLMPSTLQKRFFGGLILIVLVTGTFFGLLIYRHMNNLFLSEAHAKASLMIAHTEAIQDYVRSVLRPVVSELVPEDEFIIEAMSSSYVSRRIMDRLNFDDDFTYRRVARNARNPNSEVNAREAGLLDTLLQSEHTTRLEERYVQNGSKYLMIARPVYFVESCMRCHGDPADAPAVLRTMYGSDRGFGRQGGDLAGLDIITVPMESAGSAIGKSISIFAVCFMAGMLALLMAVQGFFNHLVVHNLRRVGYILHQKFFSGAEHQALNSLHKGVDIEQMIHTIELVAEDLSEARSQLSDYARNLETMVGERTNDLEQVVRQRSADVHLFMRLLSKLNHAQDKQSLLQTTLRLIAGHFGADRAAYMCGMPNMSMVEWRLPEADRTGTDMSGEEDVMALREQMLTEQPAMLDHVWYIPVQSRGMLALYWEETPQFPRGFYPETGNSPLQPGDMPYFRLAMAFGSQLGIALENLDALEVVLRQNTLLESIVEGVSEPLILAEGDMSPVLANSSARLLVEDLLPGIENNSEGIAQLMLLMDVPEMVECAGGIASELLQREVVLNKGRSFLVGIQPLAATHSGDFRSVIHIRETTEEKRLMVVMRQQEKLAAVGQLAAGLAHEINNPLGVIQCYAELMSSSNLDEQNQEDLKIILRHVEQARTVLRDMLDFSRSRDWSPGPCDLNALLATINDIFITHGRATGIAMSINLEADLPELYLDGRQLEQVIVNLLLNATDSVRFCHPAGGGEICMEARYALDTIVISVTDNGQGISPDVLPKVFDPFFTTKDPGHGTGLGLTIAYGIIADLGGTLEVESPLFNEDSCKGARFVINLPVGNS